MTVSEVTWDRRADVTAERAFADAVREHEPVLRGIARRLCGNDADAGDLVHDTYERALRAWDRYADRGNLRSWLVAILNNLFIDRCRKARRAPRSESVEDHDIAVPETVRAPAWANVTVEQIDRALAQVGDDFRRVYELHAAGRSYDDIATELHIPKATVGTRLLRARKKLKEVLLREIGGES